MHGGIADIAGETSGSASVVKASSLWDCLDTLRTVPRHGGAAWVRGLAASQVQPLASATYTDVIYNDVDSVSALNAGDRWCSTRAAGSGGSSIVASATRRHASDRGGTREASAELAVGGDVACALSADVSLMSF